MSIDTYYTRVDGEWVDISSEIWERVVESPSEFWVDICHGGPFAIDERYFFPDLDSAIEFYREGWKKCQFEYPEGSGECAGLSHSGLYAHGTLIEGHSIHGDAPG